MKSENFYNSPISEVATHLETSVEQGLSANEVETRREQYGPNKLNQKQQTPLWRLFLQQFNSSLVFVLIAAAVVMAVVSILEHTGNYTDSIIILAILIVNAIIGTWQEYKAMVSIEALNAMSAPHSKVLRGGNVQEINSEEIVPGDIVILDVGDIVPADMRLIESVNLKIQESALTGESVPTEKDAQAILAQQEVSPGDQNNMAFSTGLIAYGRGKGIVVHTGMNTEVGKIAGMLESANVQATPMQVRLNQLGRVLGYVALGICVVIFALGIIYGNSILDMFMMAVSLAVAAIPEGLQVISTLVLAMGVQRLAKQNAIVRTLPSVETLGSASVICSDKTGTLTQNKMTIVRLWTLDEELDVSKGDLPESEAMKQMILSGSLSNEAHMSDDPNAENRFSGDPTETAIIAFAEKIGMNKNELEATYKREAEVPFDSDRKRMSTINRSPEGQLVTHLKGGTDEVLEVCTHYYAHGKRLPLTDDIREQIKRGNIAMAEQALRVLAVATAEVSSVPTEPTPEVVEQGLTFIGLLGMIDPPRPEAIDAVAECRSAGIKPVMITGDHKVTATAIAAEMGILNEGDQVLTGEELQQLSPEELYEAVPHTSVYARVAPEHKVQIVEAWQKHGEIVSMTGDGVNDAPALKTANIGVAMGITGTEVSKGASDVILTDDNFATIVQAVREGRRIYKNIVKSIQYLLSTNIGEVALIFIATIFNLGTPLLPIHLLWINLVTDSLPALAISLDPIDKDIMQRPPRDNQAGFFTKGFIWRIIYQGIMIGGIGLAAFLIGYRDGGQAMGQTMAFIAICVSQILHIRNLHSDTQFSFKTSPFRNPSILWAMLISIALVLVVLFVPWLREIFHLQMLDAKHWWYVGGLMVAPLVIVNLFKALKINTIKGE